MPNNQQEFDDSSEVDSVNLNFNMNRRLNVDPPRDVADFVDLLSRPRPEPDHAVIKDEIVEKLPVEILLKIFSYLDDLSLWTVSEVCRKWKTILSRNTPPVFWKRYIKERFPLFQQISFVSNWMQMYCSLMSSCFCRTCLVQMANVRESNLMISWMCSMIILSSTENANQRRASNSSAGSSFEKRYQIDRTRRIHRYWRTPTWPSRNSLASINHRTSELSLRRRKVFPLHQIPLQLSNVAAARSISHEDRSSKCVTTRRRWNWHHSTQLVHLHHSLETSALSSKSSYRPVFRNLHGTGNRSTLRARNLKV